MVLHILFVPPIPLQIQISIDQPYNGPAASCCVISGTRIYIEQTKQTQTKTKTKTKTTSIAILLQRPVYCFWRADFPGQGATLVTPDNLMYSLPTISP
jgi:hypothetical protein